MVRMGGSEGRESSRLSWLSVGRSVSEKRVFALVMEERRQGQVGDSGRWR